MRARRAAPRERAARPERRPAAGRRGLRGRCRLLRRSRLRLRRGLACDWSAAGACWRPLTVVGCVFVEVVPSAFCVEPFESAVAELSEDELAAPAFDADEESLDLVDFAEAELSPLAPAPAGMSFDPFRYGAGSCAAPLTRVSKCRCGPVASPVEPT